MITAIPIIPYLSMYDYPEIAKPAGLALLLAYAHTHRHSSQWIGALLTILQRQEVTHG